MLPKIAAVIRDHPTALNQDEIAAIDIHVDQDQDREMKKIGITGTTVEIELASTAETETGEEPEDNLTEVLLETEGAFPWIGIDVTWTGVTHDAMIKKNPEIGITITTTGNLKEEIRVDQDLAEGNRREIFEDPLEIGAEIVYKLVRRVIETMERAPDVIQGPELHIQVEYHKTHHGKETQDKKEAEVDARMMKTEELHKAELIPGICLKTEASHEDHVLMVPYQNGASEIAGKDLYLKITGKVPMNKYPDLKITDKVLIDKDLDLKITETVERIIEIVGEIQRGVQEETVSPETCHSREIQITRRDQRTIGTSRRLDLGAPDPDRQTPGMVKIEKFRTMIGFVPQRILNFGANLLDVAVTQKISLEPKGVTTGMTELRNREVADAKMLIREAQERAPKIVRETADMLLKLEDVIRRVVKKLRVNHHDTPKGIKKINQRPTPKIRDQKIEPRGVQDAKLVRCHHRNAKTGIPEKKQVHQKPSQAIPKMLLQRVHATIPKFRQRRKDQNSTTRITRKKVVENLRNIKLPDRKATPELPDPAKVDKNDSSLRVAVKINNEQLTRSALVHLSRVGLNRIQIKRKQVKIKLEKVKNLGRSLNHPVIRTLRNHALQPTSKVQL